MAVIHMTPRWKSGYTQLGGRATTDANMRSSVTPWNRQRRKGVVMILDSESFEVGKWQHRRILHIAGVGDLEYDAEDSEAVAAAFETAAKKIRQAEKAVD